MGTFPFRFFTKRLVFCENRDIMVVSSPCGAGGAVLCDLAFDNGLGALESAVFGMWVQGRARF